MHIGFVAVPATVESLEEAFAAAWPSYEIADRDVLPSLDAFAAWKREHERFVPAREWTTEDPGSEVYGFLQDGEWAVLLDGSYVLASDADALSALSTRFGRCLAFVVETTGGSTSFMAFAEGHLQRSITAAGGEVRAEGDPLAEEAGLDFAHFCPATSQALQQRLGLRFLADAPPTEIVAVAAMDHTDYGELLPVAAPVLPRKPWWKLW